MLQEISVGTAGYCVIPIAAKVASIKTEFLMIYISKDLNSIRFK